MKISPEYQRNRTADEYFVLCDVCGTSAPVIIGNGIDAFPVSAHLCKHCAPHYELVPTKKDGAE